MSFSGAVTPGPCPDLSTGNNASDTDRSPVPERAKTSTSQSPFGPVVTSLSLLEMLIRLTSLQQFQQTSHLSIPDHILTFFLEETSASGLKGEERWKAKRAAEQKMGFDPFTDTPSKTKKSK
ncbi:Ran-specific GTPase-activating protein 30 [Sporothrix bragantina]|uniref:Ran-specific GTPase-activating protein 30 n=1 Tax=Sporothrix bragantina TaxID=671064 RepID=A0ABP0C1S7_9PEZI